MMIPNHIYIFLVFFFLVPAKTERRVPSSSLKTRVLQQVSCGGHYAPSCAECPQGYGAAWCNGECKWENGACVDRLVGCSDATTNNECTTTSEDCSWNTWTNLCRQKLSDDVRTASVHLNYDIPGTVEKPAWFFQRIVPQATADATYLSSNGHRFGYGGIQRVQGNVGRVLFSLWDQGGCDQDLGGCDPDNVAITVACGDGVTCTSVSGGKKEREREFCDIVCSCSQLFFSLFFSIFIYFCSLGMKARDVNPIMTKTTSQRMTTNILW